MDRSRPDNIGGRTRAILIDKNDVNHLYAGSVSGGLFESFNKANNWSKVSTFTENLAVSSMTQTPDGTVYVGTGHSSEGTAGIDGSGARGYGVYRQDGDGWTLIPTTETYSFVNEVVSDTINNVVWIACNQGLKKYTASTGALETVGGGISPGSCTSVEISVDGSLIVAATTPSRTQISTDGGVSFIDVTDDDVTPNPIDLGSGRIEYAISHEKVDGQYRVYASAANSFLTGIWRSADNGLNWQRIAPAYDGVTPGSFSPFSSGGSGQGTYDNVITVVPGAPDRIILGGIDCYQWDTDGNWEQISQWFINPINPTYVHADIHEFRWDKNGRFYVGTDGGVAFSDNANISRDPAFRHANRGYNVTQFYDIGFSAHGDVAGGSQDNGTKANYHDNGTFQEHDRLSRNFFGGDGFSTAMSFINRDILFGSVYFSSVRRSSNRGQEGQIFNPTGFSCTPGSVSGDGCGQFFTRFQLWENPNDTESTDSIRFVPQAAFLEGDIIEIPTPTSQVSIEIESPFDIAFFDTLYFNPALTIDDTIAVDATTGLEYNLGEEDWEFIFGAPTISAGDSILILGVDPLPDDTIVVESISTIDRYFGSTPLRPGLIVDLGNQTFKTDVSFDTLIVQDNKQSWFAVDMGTSNGIWMTRNALRFSSPQNWFLAFDGLAGRVLSMEFTKDGDYLFVGTQNGNLYRYTGFNQGYSITGSEVVSETGGVVLGRIFNERGDTVDTRFELIESGLGPITDIATGAFDNPDHVVVTAGGFTGSQKVRESMNATGASPTFTSLAFPTTGDGDESLGIPCYSAVIDRDDPDIILVGTEFGVYATENASGGATDWVNVSGDFGDSPIFDMGQNWRTWDEGSKRPGEIYIGSHGRGIWSTDAFLNLPTHNDNLAKDKFIPNINLYPNPLKEGGTVEFDLAANEDVTLQIFNLNGQVVRQVTETNLQKGKNQISFNADDLPRGTYILRLNSNSMSETTKFIKH